MYFQNSIIHQKMIKERRHRCTICHKKRIERKMKQVPSTILDNLTNGFYWACHGHNTENCAARYLLKRANEFYSLGDKFKSMSDKLNKYGRF